MNTALNKPSSLVYEIQLEKIDNWHLFKFSDSLQLRMEELLREKKADQLTTDKITELVDYGISVTTITDREGARG